MSEKAFHFLTIFLRLLIILDLIFKWFYSPNKYPFDLFQIEHLIVHSYLNDVII